MYFFLSSFFQYRIRIIQDALFHVNYRCPWIRVKPKRIHLIMDYHYYYTDGFIIIFFFSLYYVHIPRTYVLLHVITIVINILYI